MTDDSTHLAQILEASYREYHRALRAGDVRSVVRFLPATEAVHWSPEKMAGGKSLSRIVRTYPDPEGAVVITACENDAWAGLYFLTGLGHPTRSTLHFLRFHREQGGYKVGSLSSIFVPHRRTRELEVAAASERIESDPSMLLPTDPAWTPGTHRPEAASSATMAQVSAGETEAKTPTERARRALTFTEGILTQFIAEFLGPTTELGFLVQAEMTLPTKLAVVTRLVEDRIHDDTLRSRAVELLGKTFELWRSTESAAIGGTGLPPERAHAHYLAIFPRGEYPERPLPSMEDLRSPLQIPIEWHTFWRDVSARIP